MDLEVYNTYLFALGCFSLGFESILDLFPASISLLEAFCDHCLQDRLPSLTFEALHLTPFNLPASVQTFLLANPCSSNSLILLQLFPFAHNSPALIPQFYSSPKTHLKLLPLMEYEKLSVHRCGV